SQRFLIRRETLRGRIGFGRLGFGCSFNRDVFRLVFVLGRVQESDSTLWMDARARVDLLVTYRATSSGRDGRVDVLGIHQQPPSKGCHTEGVSDEGAHLKRTQAATAREVGRRPDREERALRLSRQTEHYCTRTERT